MRDYVNLCDWLAGGLGGDGNWWRRSYLCGAGNDRDQYLHISQDGPYTVETLNKVWWLTALASPGLKQKLSIFLVLDSNSTNSRSSHYSHLQNTRGKEVLTVLPKPMMQIFCLKVMAICLYFPDSGAVINRMIGLVDGKQIPVCLSHLLYLQTDIIYKSFCCE